MWGPCMVIEGARVQSCSAGVMETGNLVYHEARLEGANTVTFNLH